MQSGPALSLTIGSVDLAAGSSVRVTAHQSPACLLFFVHEGRVDLRDSEGFTNVPPEELTLFPLHGAVTLSTRLGASGVFLLAGPKILSRLPRSGSGVSLLPSRPVRLSPGTDSLTARLLGDCLVRSACSLREGGSARQWEKAGDLLQSLLLDALAQAVRDEMPPQEDAVPWYVTRVEKFLAEFPARTVNMRDLARMTGLSPRTLHDGFNRHRGYSPMRFLREQRMQAIRRELMDCSPLASVTDCALKWGFNHLGRFSSYYARQYGEMPSETLRKARLQSRRDRLTA